VLDDPAHAATLRARALRRAAAFTWESTARRTLDSYDLTLASSG
jgi:glycosyltransferase involved in cell wall biosynthesis